MSPLTRIVLVCAVIACGLVTTQAQTSVSRINTVATLPVNCNVGAITVKTGASAGLYACVTSNTWTGPFVTSGASSVALDDVTAAGDSATINNGVHNIVWQWALTVADEVGFHFTENNAATNGAGDQSLLRVSTVASSTAVPLHVINGGSNNRSFWVGEGSVTDTSPPFQVSSDDNILVDCADGATGSGGAAFRAVLCNGSSDVDHMIAMESAADGDFYVQMVSAEWRFRSTANKPIVFLVNSTEEARVDASGIRATGYQAADGSAGVTVTSCTQFEQGICTAGTEPAMTLDEMAQEIETLKREIEQLKSSGRSWPVAWPVLVGLGAVAATRRWL